MELILLLLIPVLILIAFLIYGKGRITIKEFLIEEAVIAALVVGGYFLAKYANKTDVEIWSGRIVNKQQVRVACSHPYPCNCRSVSCGKNCTTIHCDICYMHTHDHDWNLYFSTGSVIDVDRVDMQGENEPPRYTIAKIGDPTAEQHSFTNYVKASPWSILKKSTDLEKFKNLSPKYPKDIYDYHYINRALDLTGKVKDIALWNKELMNLNADLGAKKKVNLVIVFVPTSDPSYFHYLESLWINGKKNDLIMLIGTTNYPKIDWVNVMSWSRMETLKIELRDLVLNTGDLSKREAIMTGVYTQIAGFPNYVRRNMEDFAYLNAEIRPPLWASILITILAVALSVGLSIFFYEEDPFN